MSDKHEKFRDTRKKKIDKIEILTGVPVKKNGRVFSFSFLAVSVSCSVIYVVYMVCTISCRL